MYLEDPYPQSEGFLTFLLGLSAQLDLAPGPGGSRLSDYPISLALFKPVLDPYFPGLTHCTVAALYPGSQIIAHRDAPIEGRRFHLPLQTNDRCWSFHDGTWDHLKVGRLYQMDPTVRHGAVNWGEDLRLHLILDVT